jgi:hypothetical protein
MKSKRIVIFLARVALTVCLMTIAFGSGQNCAVTAAIPFSSECILRCSQTYYDDVAACDRTYDGGRKDKEGYNDCLQVARAKYDACKEGCPQ